MAHSFDFHRVGMNPRWRHASGWQIWQPADKATFRVLSEDGYEYAQRFRSFDKAASFAFDHIRNLRTF